MNKKNVKTSGAARKRKTMTSVEVQEVLNISKRTFLYWRKDDSFPCVKIKGKLFVDPVKLRDWLVVNDKDEQAARLEEYLGDDIEARTQSPSGKSAPKGKTLVKAPVPKEPPSRVDLNIDIDPDIPMDIFQAKRIIGQLLAKNIEILTAVGGIEAVIETKNTVALTEQLRKLESDCIDIDKKLGSVVLISEVRKWISEIFTKVKTDLRGLPFAAADELAAMSDPEKIAEFLKKKIDDALRHLAKGFNEQSIKKSI